MRCMGCDLMMYCYILLRNKSRLGFWYWVPILSLEEKKKVVNEFFCKQSPTTIDMVSKSCSVSKLQLILSSGCQHTNISFLSILILLKLKVLSHFTHKYLMQHFSTKKCHRKNFRTYCLGHFAFQLKVETLLKV